MFKIVWDPEYNGVRLTMSSKGDALNVSPRPVFWEELDLLGLNTKGWIYPHVEEPLSCDSFDCNNAWVVVIRELYELEKNHHTQ